MGAPSKPLLLAIGAAVAGLVGLFLLAQTDPRATACLRSHRLMLCEMEHPYLQIGAALVLACVVLGMWVLSAARRNRARPPERSQDSR